MGTLNLANPTLADVVSRLDGEHKIDSEIVEVLSETNEMLQDITTLEANGVTEHLTTVRTGLPTATWRMLNYGVQPSKSTTAQVKDSIGMVAALSEIDVKLGEINGWKEAWRRSEDSAFIEALSQMVQRALFFGNDKTGSEQILGLAPRYASGKKSVADNAVNVINAGGTGSNLTSIWLVTWSPKTLFCTYPKGSRAGLQHKDLGTYMTNDPAGGKYQVAGSLYEWDLGLVLRDWRYCVRIANIDPTAIKADVSDASYTGPKLLELMTTATNRLPSMSGGRMAFYMNRDLVNALELQAQNTKNVQLSYDHVTNAHPVLRYRGIPVRRVDALTATEKAVVCD